VLIVGVPLDGNDGPQPPGGGATRPQASRADPAHLMEPGAINCHCGVRALQRESNTETTRGRKFWRCGGSGEDCQFFHWVDTPPNRQISGANGGAIGGGGKFGSGNLGNFEDHGGGSDRRDSGNAAPAKRRVSLQRRERHAD